MATKRVTVKKKCCQDGPRCKRCPAVLKKLENAGRARRVGKREYVMVDVSAKALKAARKRG
jgi:hypothetical protein